MATLFVLYESASGLALFQKGNYDEIADTVASYQNSTKDFAKFKNVVKWVDFVPFTSEKHALECANDISEGILNETLQSLIERHITTGSKKVALGLQEEKLAASVQENLGISCKVARQNDAIWELLRGIRLHFQSFIPALGKGDVEKAQLGLGRAYSRGKIKFNVNRVDNMIIQSIALLDQLNKDINTYAMRVREWYSWNFPELVPLVSENNILYTKCVQYIQSKDTFTEDKVEGLGELLQSPELAQQIYQASRHSMGREISDFDMVNIEHFATRVIDLDNYKGQLYVYLQKKLADNAPNLAALVGEVIAARLIAQAGSMTNLAKCPASTIQILGAEKALFRALKTRGPTPKYGLIFNSSFISKANAKNKGRISRFLSNRCAIAARVDCFSEFPTSKFGEAMKGQVEERLNFYETGTVPRRNIEVMSEVYAEVQAEAPKTPSKKRKSTGGAEATPPAAKKAKPTPKQATPKQATPKGAKKPAPVEAEEDVEVETPKKAKPAAPKAKATPKKAPVVEEDGEEEAEAPAPKPKAAAKASPKKPAAKKPVEEDAEEEEAEAPAPKPKAAAKASPKKPAAKKPVVEEEAEEDAMEEEEAPAPKPKASPKQATPKRAPKK